MMAVADAADDAGVADVVAVGVTVVVVVGVIR